MTAWSSKMLPHAAPAKHVPLQQGLPGKSLQLGPLSSRKVTAARENCCQCGLRIARRPRVAGIAAATATAPALTQQPLSDADQSAASSRRVDLPPGLRKMVRPMAVFSIVIESCRSCVATALQDAHRQLLLSVSGPPDHGNDIIRGCVS